AVAALITGGSMFPRTRRFPSFLALATISSWLVIKLYPLASASRFAFSTAGLATAPYAVAAGISYGSAAKKIIARAFMLHLPVYRAREDLLSSMARFRLVRCNHGSRNHLKPSLLSLYFRKAESLDDLSFPLRRNLLLLPRQRGKLFPSQLLL